jgi:hypothetical protein
MVSLSNEQIVENMNEVKFLITTLDQPRRDLVEKMMAGPVGDEYFTAPASSREEYHDCFPGGLCQHSLDVRKQLFKISDALAPKVYPESILTFVSLFHDLGKAGDGEHPLYLPNPEVWQRNKGNLYVTNRECVYMPIAERSLFVLQKFGIVMTSDEYLAIRLHDGQYEDANRGYRMKEPDLSLLLHFADRWAIAVEKTSA